ncbi:hypothetical protein COOONC_11785, partial [Cooperia oncophora]
MVTRHFNKSRLVAVTRFEGSIFVMDQKESISIWLWRQQKMWTENYAAYIEREKSMPLSLKQSPKKSARTDRTDETQSKSPNSVYSRLVQVFAMVTRHFNKSRLVAVTRFEGSIFVMDQKESISIWHTELNP